jgi:hypothetical protein
MNSVGFSMDAVILAMNSIGLAMNSVGFSMESVILAMNSVVPGKGYVENFERKRGN